MRREREEDRKREKKRESERREGEREVQSGRSCRSQLVYFWRRSRDENKLNRELSN